MQSQLVCTPTFSTRKEGLSREEVRLIKEPTCYLWTDAFAVCNFLELYHQTDEPEQLQWALELDDQVHQTLGKYHKESNHKGWISGLDDQQACLRPILDSLRIGKILDELQANNLLMNSWNRIVRSIFSLPD